VLFGGIVSVALSLALRPVGVTHCLLPKEKFSLGVFGLSSLH